VEDCRVLDIGRFVQEGVITPNRSARGSWQWSRNGERVADVGYEVETRADAGSLRLRYTVGRDGQERSAQDYVIPLETTVLVSGGRRWWFWCVACRGGGPPCRRRVAKLYLPPGGVIFACRRCYDLAYTSSRESRKWDSMFKKLALRAGLPFGTVKEELLGWSRAARQDALFLKKTDSLVKRAEKLSKRRAT
jgi:hypothetical protein